MKLLVINAKPMLIDALAATPGVEVTALWPRRHHFAHLAPPVRVPIRYYCGGRKLSARAIWQLRQLIRAERPEVVHAFYGRALAHAAMACVGQRPAPRLVSFRGISSPLSALNAGDWLSYRHPRVDAHACESEAVRQAMIDSGIDASRCFVTYNTTYSETHNRPGRAALRQFDIPEDAFVVATMGTFRRVKGADILLRAAIECADLSNTYWLLIGTVIDSEIFRLASDSRIRDRVRLAGYQPDAAELISGADLFVMPSRAEALCQSLLEAMSQRVCPVVSDAGGMPEVVRHNRDGLVVPAADHILLANAIRKLYENRPLLNHFAISAEQRVAGTFTPPGMAERCVAMYRRLQDRSTAAAA
jgi:glycosyltransferase involved in cell wall biosynthesis